MQNISGFGEADILSGWEKEESEEYAKVFASALETHAPTVKFLLEQGLKFEACKASKLILEHEPLNDLGEAVYDHRGLSEGSNDVPKFQLGGLPLPIIYCDVIGDVSWAVGEVCKEVEATLLGIKKPFQLPEHAPRIYGFLNHPKAQNFRGIGDAVKSLNDDEFYGPYIIIHGSGLCPIPDTDLQISHVLKSPALAPLDAILVQLTSDVIRMVVGMMPAVLKNAGEQRKVICILVPQLRFDFYGRSGFRVSRG